MTIHTPGPWRVGRVGAVVADHPVPALQMPGADDVEYYGGHLIAESITDNNAPLIAAAPELLDALRSFCGDYESTNFESKALNAAYLNALTIIAKADPPAATPKHESAKPCGCDPGANWTCEQHRNEAQS